MASYEQHIFYESEKELPKIDQSILAIEDNIEDFNENTEKLLLYLRNLEILYIEHIKANKNKPDTRVVNEIFFACYKMFNETINICIIYNEIIDFFQFDNIYFYNLLTNDFKTKLKIALSKRIDVNIIMKERKIKIKENGGEIPTFSQLMNLL